MSSHIKCLSKRKLDNKVVLITGGNSGIGKETAYQLSLRGAQIIIGCRNITKGNEAINDIKSKNPKANIRVFQLDLGSLLSVRKFAQTVAQHESTIDILINNAGVVSYVELQTEDGFELQFGTNHLGHFLLTHLLLPLLKNSQKAKVINVSSKAHKTGKIHFENINLRNGIFTPLKAYSQSKLANVLFTREMTRRLGPKSSITTYCLHPGIVRTDLNRHFPLQFAINIFINMFYLDIESGVQTTLYCALDPSLDNESAFYYELV
ncbi:retinol dehydrogenase 13-like [Oppia nitens]|uniref:retinol dehydrogenase 13-like n=1 Tax=Oppia nitens TaxID=1686743 RepID=UPI0023DB4A45|nr:retinol dehydrogenase 13-like [Oppia nitens]